ncbi:hypothetical protein C9374_012381 [Naegleria lovaniensis]|uniref:protein-tyrosine-phosphatase n=1 Tax=Naegleria lovaniensis TaxID=51637 RepID=A0AA88GX15_NAELO|nr:uncharacterized protein C9374_012381 [Naegleria lovaniensis]KAG2392129.1 hypothetical protein C9374_012381 [Naegleria lovaniensis]
MEVFDRILLGNKDDACDIHLFKEQNIGLVINVTDNIDNHFENKTEIKIKLRKHEQTEMMRSLSQSSEGMDELVFDEEDENITPKKASLTSFPQEEEDENSSSRILLSLDEEKFIPTPPSLKHNTNVSTPTQHGFMDLSNHEQLSHPSMTTTTTVSEYLLVPSQYSSSSSALLDDNMNAVPTASQLSLVSAASSDPMLVDDSESVMSSNAFIVPEESSRMSSMSDAISRFSSSNTLDSMASEASHLSMVDDANMLNQEEHSLTTPNQKKATTPKKSSSKKRSSSKKTTPSRKKPIAIYRSVKLNHPIIYHKISIEDSSEILISEYFDEAIAIIQRFLEEYPDRKVLIHCREGRSRSVSTLIAFGMKHLKMSLKDCYEHVTEKIDGRDRINDGFKRQLMQYELKLKKLQAMEAVKASKREEHFKTNPEIPFNEDFVVTDLPDDIHVNSYSFFNRNKYGKNYAHKSARGKNDDDGEDDMDFDEEDEFEYEEDEDDEDLDDEDFDESYGTKKKKKKKSSKQKGRGTTRQQKLFSKSWEEIKIEEKQNKSQGKQLSLMDMFAKKVKKVETGSNGTMDAPQAKTTKQSTESLFSPKKPKKQTSAKKKTTPAATTSNKKDVTKKDTPLLNNLSATTEANSDIFQTPEPVGQALVSMAIDNQNAMEETSMNNLPPQDFVTAMTSESTTLITTAEDASQVVNAVTSSSDKLQSISQSSTTTLPSKKKKESKKDQSNGSTKKIFKRAPRLPKPEETSSVATDEKTTPEEKPKKKKNEAKKRKKDETTLGKEEKKNKSHDEEGSKKKREKKKSKKEKKNPPSTSTSPSAAPTDATGTIVNVQPQVHAFNDHELHHSVPAATTAAVVEHEVKVSVSDENKENIVPLPSSSTATTADDSKKKKINSIMNYFKPKAQHTATTTTTV